MGTQRFVIATVAGFITLFLLGFLAYGLLLADFFAASAGAGIAVMRDPPFLWAIALGELFAAALLTIVIGRWAGCRSAGEGARIAALFALLLGLSMGLTLYGVMDASTVASMIVDVIVTTIRFAIAGAVIGAVLARGGEAPAEYA